MPLKLKVPYSEKDEAKWLGAKWDANEKIWFVPDEVDYVKFSKWFENKDINILVTSPLYIAKNSCQCWKCKKEITAVSLCSRSFKMLENEIEENADDFVFFTDITYIPKEVINILETDFQYYYYDYSKTVRGKYWANHCPYCKALQGDFFLHSEPGGAFFPVDEDSMKELVFIKLPLKYNVGLAGGIGYSSIFNDNLDTLKTIDLEEYIRLNK